MDPLAETCDNDNPATIRYWLAENLRELKRQLRQIDPDAARYQRVFAKRTYSTTRMTRPCEAFRRETISADSR